MAWAKIECEGEGLHVLWVDCDRATDCEEMENEFVVTEIMESTAMARDLFVNLILLLISLLGCYDL